MINAIATRFRQLLAGRNNRKNKTKRSIVLYTSIGLAGGILAFLLIASPGLAQKPEPQQSPKLQQSLLVATRVIPPFVLSNKGELSGFSIDLWRSIATQIGAESKFSGIFQCTGTDFCYQGQQSQFRGCSGLDYS